MCFPLMCYLCLKVLRHHLQWMKPLLVGNDRLTDKQFFPFIQYKTTTNLHKENWNVFQINDNWKELTFQWNNEIKKPKNPHSLSSKITKSNEFSFIIFIFNHMPYKFKLTNKSWHDGCTSCDMTGIKWLQ